jgi:hypothetical protein
MIRLTATIDPSYLDELAKAVEVETIERFRLAADQLGREVIDYLKSLADPPEFRPGLARSKKTGKLYQPTFVGPRRANRQLAIEGPRRAHPGHWADRSGQLALSYTYEVLVDRNGVSLVFRNTAEYAFWVEVHDGFFVLSGVLDEGGPADKAFRAIAAKLYPDWRVENSGTRAFEATET